MVQKLFDKFGLTHERATTLDRSRRSLLLLIGLVVVMVFAVVISIVPEVSNRFGEIAQKKETQITKAALGSPCTYRLKDNDLGLGDYDGDGDVDSLDLQKVINHFQGNITNPPYSVDVRKRADVDGDLDVDLVDGSAIQNYTSGVFSTFEMCLDQDLDGFLNGVERYIGTDPYKNCGSDGWPADLYTQAPSTNLITIQDLTSFFVPDRILGTKPGDNYILDGKTHRYDRRWDLRPGPFDWAPEGDHINIQDLTELITATAPMFGGNRIFAYPNPCVPGNAVTLNFNKSPQSEIMAGETIKLYWSSTNAVFPCKASGDWEGHRAVSNPFSSAVEYQLNIAGTYSYTLKCFGQGGIAEKTQTVTVLDSPEPPGPGPDPPQAQCSDGIDNDGDLLTDYPSDSGCTSASDNSEEDPTDQPRGWPTSGTISGGIHYTSIYPDAPAIDITGSSGTPIYSTLDGIVTLRQFNDPNCGNGVDITSSSGWLLHYCHMTSSVQVNTNDSVSRDTLLGYMSNTGTSAVHLHYAIQQPGVNNPLANPGEMAPDNIPLHAQNGLQVSR